MGDSIFAEHPLLSLPVWAPSSPLSESSTSASTSQYNSALAGCPQWRPACHWKGQLHPLQALLHGSVLQQVLSCRYLLKAHETPEQVCKPKAYVMRGLFHQTRGRNKQGLQEQSRQNQQGQKGSLLTLGVKGVPTGGRYAPNLAASWHSSCNACLLVLHAHALAQP